MFDAKSILDMILKGAQPAPQPHAQGGGLGGLGDILGQLQKQMGGGGQQAPQMPQGGGGMGGLGDILGQLQKQMGGAGQSPNMAPQSGGQGGGGGNFGGLGDLLGQLQKQIGGAGQGGQGHAPQHAPQPQAQQGGGGLMDILGQVLGQAKSGVQEGAGRINEATGASERAREAVGQASGRSPEELLAQLQEWIRNNPGTAAAGAGGLGAVVLGTRTGRGMLGSAAKLGALALIGGLAYKALQNYQSGRPLISSGDPRGLIDGPAPSGSGFEPDAISNDTATLYIRSMIAAAAADGRIDAKEQQQIIGGLQQAGIGSEAQAFLENEVQNPASIEDLVAGVSSPEEAVQVYTAARLAVDPDTRAETQFLAALAQRLGIDQNLQAHIDASARAAAA